MKPTADSKCLHCQRSLDFKSNKYYFCSILRQQHADEHSFYYNIETDDFYLELDEYCSGYDAKTNKYYLNVDFNYDINPNTIILKSFNWSEAKNIIDKYCKLLPFS